jgi:[ribosomal protein S5]-alanine N-acetyltransferase
VDATLSTARLALRWLTIADADFMLKIWNDTDFVRYVGDRGLRSDEEARLALENGPLRLYAELGYGPYLLTLKSTGEPIGICGLFRREGLPDPDIGFALLPGYRGDGYAREAADAVIGEARNSLGLTRLTAIVAAENASSVRLIEKLGLRFEQMLRLGGDEREACLYAVDWQ